MRINPFEAGLEAPDSSPTPPQPSMPKPSHGCTKQQRWEHKVVSRILIHLGLAEQAWDIARAANEQHGLWRLTFANFHEANLWAFPAWLACEKIPWVHTVTFADLQRRFTKSRLFKSFEAAEAVAPEAYRRGGFGLVFEWLHVWPMAVIHSCPDAIPADEPVIFRTWPAVDPPQVVAVQSLDSFLRTLVVAKRTDLGADQGTPVPGRGS